MEIPEGKITALIGANGSGKSTILKTLCRIMKPDSGQVILDGRSIHQMKGKELARRLAILPQGPEAPEGLTKTLCRIMKPDSGQVILDGRSIHQMKGKELARRLAILPQGPEAPEGLTVEELAAYGRSPHRSGYGRLSEKDNEEYKKTIVMVVHDLNHASLFADHIVAIKKGKILRAGKPDHVITSQTCQEVFGVMADVFTDPRTNRPLCIPYDHVVLGREE